jgi:hypothetical protein
MLCDVEVEHLLHSPSADRKHLMWVAFCRRYEMVGEFAEEVLRERFLLGVDVLSPEDFEMFWARKLLWHEELDVVKPSTHRKLRTNLFLAMRQADLLNGENVIQPPLISRQVGEFLSARNPSDLRFFPVLGDIK